MANQEEVTKNNVIRSHIGRSFDARRRPSREKCTLMAKMIKESNVAMRPLIAKMKAKFAELDALDGEFNELDAAMPEGEGGAKFDLLSEKREELETEIRNMRERVQLISEWEKFKGGEWSEDVKADLNALDQQFADIADGGAVGGDFDAGLAGLDPLASPALPPIPDASLAPEAPITPEAPVTPEATPALEPLPDEASVAPPAEPLAPAVASNATKSSKKINYGTQDKKGSVTQTSSTSQIGDTHMANTTTKPSLKEKLAEVKSKREAISKEAKTRVASAWTIAKTMLPTAPAEVQKAFAASLLNSSTKVLKAALRQTAINAHYTKVAETFKEVHKVELNDLLEDPSILKAEKKAVESEVKGDAKSATSKKADDRKESGPQEGTYDDGRKGSEPKELDASKAGERPDAGEKPVQTQNLSEGDSKKAASAKKACSGADCKGCPNCKKAAEGDEFPPAEGAAPVEGEAPVEAPPTPEAAEAPAELPPPTEGNPEAEAGEILTDEKKMVVEEKIEEAQEAIKALESEILEEGAEELDLAKIDGEGEGLEGLGEFGEEPALEGEGLEGEGEEIDLSKVFDEDGMDEKAASLANEGEEKTSAEEDDFFAPSAASSLEASMDDDGMGDMHSMFSLQGSDGDPLASLIAGLKTAEQVAGMDVVESFSEAAEHFKQEEATSDDRDTENDHSDTLWAETIKGITPEEQGAKRVKQDSTNELQAPKAAANTLKKIRPNAGASDKTAAARVDIGEAFFNDGFED